MNTEATLVLAENLLKHVKSGNYDAANKLINSCISSYGLEVAAKILVEFTKIYVLDEQMYYERLWAVAGSVPPDSPPDTYVWMLNPDHLEFRNCSTPVVTITDEKTSRKMFIQLARAGKYRYTSDATKSLSPPFPEYTCRYLSYY